MAAAKRNTGESFKEYRSRLVEQAFQDKVRRRGILIWSASLHGTYIRKRDGALN